MTLTPFERRLLVKMAHGKTIKQIAAELGRHPQTLKNRLVLTYAKLGVTDRFGAFLELGWMTPPDED